MTPIGDAASTRLAGVGAGIAEQVVLANRHATTLGEAADTAHGRLDLLLALLPRAHDETGALAGLLKTTGITASEHAAALDARSARTAASLAASATAQ